MSKTKNILILFIVLLISINFAYAQDYSIYSGKFHDLKEDEGRIEFEYYNATYNICEGEEKNIPILLQNKDVNNGNTYSLEVFGAGWANINVKEFSLPKKQSGTIFLILSPGQNTNGKYNVKISALSSIGKIEKDLGLNINVEKCYSLKLELEREQEKLCGGTKKQYAAEITNDGQQKSDVELKVSGPDWTNIDENTFSVAENDKKKFEVNVNVPYNAKGFFEVVIDAMIKEPISLSSKKILKFDIVPKYECYKADIVTDAEIRSYYGKSYIPIKIRNNGIKQSNYTIGLEAQNWVSAEPKNLIVNPGQFGNWSLILNPDAEIPEGKYSIKINAHFEDMAYSRNIDIVLKKENQFLKKLKSFSIFYQYYLYVTLLIAIVLFIFRRQISNKISTSYKNHKIRKIRLKALEAARNTRLAKIKK